MAVTNKKIESVVGLKKWPSTLLIPSWYPENLDDPRGSFFREQAQALVNAGLPLSVLVIRKRSVSRSRLLLAIAKGSVGRKWQSDEGVPTCEWILPTLVNPKFGWLEPWMIRRAWRWMERRSGPFDLFYAHCALNGGRWARDFARLSGRPYLVHEHFTGYLRKSLSNAEWTLTARVYKDAAGVYGVSRFFATFLEERVCKSSCSIGVLPNFLSREFENAGFAIEPHPQFLFVSLGRLVVQKNYDLLLKAFAQAFAGTKEKLLIGGQGPEEGKLRKLSQDLGVESQVEFGGAVPRKDVVSFLRRGKVFVLSSQIETFGVVLIESLSLGMPVVATACGGPEDIVRASNGLLVPPDDCNALAAALRQIQNPADYWDSAAIREDILRRFGRKAVTSKIISSCQAVTQDGRLQK